MRPNESLRAQRATTALIERLERGGVPATATSLAASIPAVLAAADRDAVLAAADGIVATLAPLGIDCSKSKALEAVACARGHRNWAAFSALLKASAPVARPASILDGLVTGGIEPREGTVICRYMHPGDCRPEGIVLIVEGDSDAGRERGAVSLMRGVGPSREALARTRYLGGTDGWLKAADKLAGRWMGYWETTLPEDMSSYQLQGLCRLFSEGFRPVHTGGGVMLWGLEQDGITYRIGDAETGGLDVSTERPVILDLAEEEDDTLVQDHPGVTEALMEVRRHAAARGQRTTPETISFR